LSILIYTYLYSLHLIHSIPSSFLTYPHPFYTCRYLLYTYLYSSLIHSILVWTYIYLLIFQSSLLPNPTPACFEVWLVEVCGVFDVLSVWRLCGCVLGFELVLTLGVRLLLYYILLYTIHYIILLLYYYIIILYIIIYYILYYYILYSSHPLISSLPHLFLPHHTSLIHSILVDTYLCLLIFLKP
jgi:hypothetical protein